LHPPLEQIEEQHAREQDASGREAAWIRRQVRRDEPRREATTERSGGLRQNAARLKRRVDVVRRFEGLPGRGLHEVTHCTNGTTPARRMPSRCPPGNGDGSATSSSGLVGI